MKHTTEYQIVQACLTGDRTAQLKLYEMRKNYLLYLMSTICQIKSGGRRHAYRRLSCLCYNSINAQEISQSIRGTVIDAESKAPLIGANTAIELPAGTVGTSTDINGDFEIQNILAGRHQVIVTYLGYDPSVIRSLLVTSGKEKVLNINLVESALKMEEVVVTTSQQLDKTKALNEFASTSARTFSVLETARYAAASFDLARISQNFAGLSMIATEGLFNEIVIHGNTPSGVLWRLEGFQIPYPNHFGSIGNAGGAISMLSSTILSNSDFYTGAFHS